ncbi:TetR/AcrR family transcriptional regulator [Nocardia rhizosphaerihabitans]|uniref:Transcriptional regulator, TetR family protein n=1 Tax=Nocardia rhizosphaerihabitans TaxID=1691570 RepID=A0ABQ2L398_9NOCA|nr:TetR/AcrR family transcriptional regulator [Nocardia rhizosphaerihabitans]GGO00959.1 putative transcriptional regulator, TetR family protein [Nocardia rhizosphaerihabitans]
MTDLVDEMPSYPVSTYVSARRRAVRAARAARSAQLLRAASRTFVVRGHHAAGMDEIAALAGVGKPILYQHFSGKLKLYLAVLHSRADTLVSGPLQALRSTSDNHQRVRAAVQAYFDFVDDEARGFRLIFESGIVSEPLVQRLVDRATDARVDAVFELVFQNSRLDPYQSRILAVGMVGASQVTARYWLDTARLVPKHQAVETAVALWWSGLSGIQLQVADRSR